MSTALWGGRGRTSGTPSSSGGSGIGGTSSSSASSSGLCVTGTACRFGSSRGMASVADNRLIKIEVEGEEVLVDRWGSRTDQSNSFSISLPKYALACVLGRLPHFYTSVFLACLILLCVSSPISPLPPFFSLHKPENMLCSAISQRLLHSARYVVFPSLYTVRGFWLCSFRSWRYSWPCE